MIKIATRVHQYIPIIEQEDQIQLTTNNVTVEVTENSSVLHQLLFGGDQLTAARIRGAKQVLLQQRKNWMAYSQLLKIGTPWLCFLRFVKNIVLKYYCIVISSVGDMEVFLYIRFFRRTLYTLPVTEFN